MHLDGTKTLQTDYEDRRKVETAQTAESDCVGTVCAETKTQTSTEQGSGLVSQTFEADSDEKLSASDREMYDFIREFIANSPVAPVAPVAAMAPVTQAITQALPSHVWIPIRMPEKWTRKVRHLEVDAGQRGDLGTVVHLFLRSSFKSFKSFAR